MSASEKLKARLYPVMDVKRLTLTEASALVAVVEAAENNEYATDAFDKALHAALAALDEALS